MKVLRVLGGVVLLVVCPVFVNAETHTKAFFAMGCFWCAEAVFEGKPGIVSVVSGYANANKKNPTYKEVSTETVSAFESIEITYDSKRIRYEELLELFWQNIDYTQANGQFCDIGHSYQAVILPTTADENAIAQQSKIDWQKKTKKNVVTSILFWQNFWPAEEYHQDYAQKNPVQYNYYKYACGRSQRLKKLAAE